jgi:hypothetical protein
MILFVVTKERMDQAPSLSAYQDGKLLVSSRLSTPETLRLIYELAKAMNFPAEEVLAPRGSPPDPHN